MKAISKCLVVVMLLSAVSLFAQAPTPAPAPAPPAQAPPAAQAEKAFEGTLVKVDTAAKALIAKGADNKEMEFTYDDKTQVMGPEKTVQGLASKAGAKVKVTFRVEKGENHATRIEVAN